MLSIFTLHGQEAQLEVEAMERANRLITSKRLQELDINMRLAALKQQKLDQILARQKKLETEIKSRMAIASAAEPEDEDIMVIDPTALDEQKEAAERERQRILAF